MCPGHSFEDLLKAIDNAGAQLIEMLKEKTGNETANGKTAVETRFGSFFTIDDWRKSFTMLLEGDESWWPEQTDRTRTRWMNSLQRVPSLDIYSNDFPSEDRVRGSFPGPHRKSGQSWLEGIITNDLENLSRNFLPSVTATTRTREALNSESIALLATFTEGKFSVATRRRYPRLEQLVKNVFSKNFTEETGRQVVASLHACVTVFEAARDGGLPVYIVGDHYLPNAPIFAKLLGDDASNEEPKRFARAEQSANHDPARHQRAEDLPPSWALPGLTSDGLEILWNLSHKSGGRH
ncbi:uncharacterized protein JCM6883_005612, partial [Sporobolomyces salmoneus]|uniref:uncharacterized protein n=1 Tax=Sporobolomyces salmoneus TaxID=183962 RepID=UPI00316E286F